MFIQKLKPLTDNIKIYFQTSLKEWKSDKVFYGILFIWMVGGATFLIDFFYRVSNFAITYVSPFSAYKYEYPWIIFEKNFLLPISICLLLSSFITWQLIKNFNIAILKKGIIIYLTLAVVFILWTYILEGTSIKISRLAYINCRLCGYIPLVIFMFFTGQFAVQNQVFLIFWFMILLPRANKNKTIKNSLKKKILILLLLLFIFFMQLGTLAYWQPIKIIYTASSDLLN